jgi:TonB-linked SusC/RagA family outer membrane protein
MKKNTRACIHALAGNVHRLAYFLLLFGLLASPLARAAYLPPATITGKVTDGRNAPLEGVSVLVKGTKKGVTTNSAGSFTINNVPENGVLIFSFTGFESKEVSVRGQSVVNVSLVEQVTGLNDVVVVGYGTRTKKDLTGAVTQVKATQFENENPRSVGDMLRGNAPGLDVSFDATTKGSNSSLQIRGKGTLTANSAPLIVLDGVIYPGGLEDINPNDIATMDILKDASSAAVFGARSANGVILISTKKGKLGKATITFNDNIGLNKVQNTPHLLTAQEYVNFRGEAEWALHGFDSTSVPNVKYKYTNPAALPSGLTVPQWLAIDGSAATADPTTVWLTRNEFKTVEINNYLAGRFLDWQSIIYNQNALQHDHTVSISQRKEDFNYYLSLGYLENQGLTNGDKYKTLRLRTNLEGNVAKYLSVGLNIQFAERDESAVPLSLSDLLNSTPLGSIYADGSTTTLRNSVNDDPGNNTNPLMSQYYTKRMYKYDNFFGNLYAKGNLPFGFSYQVNFAPRFDLLREYNYQSANNPLILAKKGIIDRRNQTVYSWTWDNVLRWNKTFGKHGFEVTLLANAEKFQQWNTLVHAENLQPNGNLGYNSLQAATQPPIVSSDDQYSTGDALMGRLNYNYNQRYFLTATLRRDGYSAFGQQNPRATFPSLAAAWTFSEEKFMKGTDHWLDYAKARISYGENGNREIGRYAALSNFSSGTYTFITSGGTVYSVGQVSASNLANPELQWERNSSINAGIDFSLFRGVVSGSIDYYTRDTKNLLVNRSLPTITGFNNILVNLGEVTNDGMEFSFNTQNMKRRNFEWRSTVAFWFNTNKIKHLYGPTPDYDATGKQIGTSEKDDAGNNWYIGHNINSVYDYKIVGVWQISEAAQAKSYGYKPGDMKLEDANGDGQYTIADKQFLGQTVPKFSWNLRNEFRIYNNFDFSFTLYAKMGQLSQFNQAKNVDHFYNRANFYQRPYWTPGNPINDYAAIGSNASGPVSWNVYRKSSFVRLSNISLAYTVPSAVVRRWGVEGLKAYFNIVNLAAFSSWNYFDPEYHGTGASNLPTNETPVPITYNFGINLTL